MLPTPQSRKICTSTPQYFRRLGRGLNVSGRCALHDLATTPSRSRRPAGRSDFETGKLEGWSNDAGDKAPGAYTLSGLPNAQRDDGLWALACGNIGAEADGFCLLTVRAEVEPEGRAGVPKPDLGSVDGVPVRALALLKQEINGSNRRTRAGLSRNAKRFCVPATFRMRSHPERLDDDLRVGLGIKLQAFRPEIYHRSK